VSEIHVGLGFTLIAVNLIAGVLGGYGWWRHVHVPGFWPLLRIGQGLVMLQAVDGAVLLLLGHDLPELHLIYGLVPIGVSFLAEQLRLAAADTVLAQRGLEGRADVEALPPVEQRGLVNAILRREMGVMAASALVVAALGARAL
jgi:hypothetical protein